MFNHYFFFFFSIYFLYSVYTLYFIYYTNIVLKKNNICFLNKRFNEFLFLFLFLYLTVFNFCLYNFLFVLLFIFINTKMIFFSKNQVITQTMFLIYCFFSFILANTNNFNFIILIVELVTIFFSLYLCSDKNTEIAEKKKILINMLLLNIITLLLFFLVCVLINFFFKSTNLQNLTLLIQIGKNQILFLIILASILVKLGFLIGPKIVLNLYLNFNPIVFILYLIGSYFVIPFFFYNVFFVFININIFIFIFLFNLYLLKYFFFKLNWVYLLFLSNQVNLIYFFLTFI